MELSTTSYALLGLLSIRDWTTYELANQTKRSLRFFLPRAERHLYAEAKRLTDAGLARSTVGFTGRRRSTTYAITPAGRKALQQWTRTPPAPPILESEVVLRTFFADSGRPKDVIAALDVARTQAIAAQRDLATMAQARIEGVGPFPERAAMGAISMRLITDFHRLVESWATWAAAEVETWDHPDGRDWDGARAVFADIATVAADDERVDK